MKWLQHLKWRLAYDEDATIRADYVEDYLATREWSHLPSAGAPLYVKLPPRLREKLGWIYE